MTICAAFPSHLMWITAAYVAGCGVLLTTATADPFGTYFPNVSIPRLPNQRVSCNRIYNMSTQTLSGKPLGPHTAFRALIFLLHKDEYPESYRQQPDAICSKSFRVFFKSAGYWPQYSFLESTFEAMTACNVDSSKRTMLMKIVANGLHECISEAAPIVNGDDLAVAQDLFGNQILHLAVQSDKPIMVRWVLEQFPLRNAEMLSSINLAGLTPVDLASSKAVNDVLNEFMTKSAPLRRDVAAETPSTTTTTTATAVVGDSQEAQSALPSANETIAESLVKPEEGDADEQLSAETSSGMQPPVEEKKSHEMPQEPVQGEPQTVGEEDPEGQANENASAETMAYASVIPDNTPEEAPAEEKSTEELQGAAEEEKSHEMPQEPVQGEPQTVGEEDPEGQANDASAETMAYASVIPDNTPEEDSQVHSEGEKSGEQPEASYTEKSGEDAEASSTEKSGEDAEASSTDKSGEDAEASSTEKSGEQPEASSTEKSGEDAEASSTEKSGEDAEASSTVDEPVTAVQKDSQDAPKQNSLSEESLAAVTTEANVRPHSVTFLEKKDSKIDHPPVDAATATSGPTTSSEEASKTTDTTTASKESNDKPKTGLLGLGFWGL